MTGGTATAEATLVRCPGCGKASRVRPVPRGTPRCAGCKRSLPWLVEADERRFDDEVRASVPVLVDLWAPWCAPCRVVAPALERLADERAGHLKVVKADVDAAPAVAQRFRVQGIPLLVLLRDGEEIARLSGAAPLEQLRRWVDEHGVGGGRPAGEARGQGR